MRVGGGAIFLTKVKPSRGTARKSPKYLSAQKSQTQGKQRPNQISKCQNYPNIFFSVK